MKKIILVLILCLFCLQSEARMTLSVVGGSVPAGATCATQTARWSFTTLTEGLNMYSGTYVWVGQTFTVSQAGELYSVKLYSLYGGVSNVTVRIDDDGDLSSEYLASKTVSFNGNAEWVEIVFDTPRASLSTSTTYYAIIYTDAADYDHRLRVYYGADTSSDPRFYAPNSGYEGNNTWNFTNLGGGSNDLAIEVMICD